MSRRPRAPRQPGGMEQQISTTAMPLGFCSSVCNPATSSDFDGYWHVPQAMEGHSEQRISHAWRRRRRLHPPAM